jgi:hypothetical protein
MMRIVAARLRASSSTLLDAPLSAIMRHRYIQGST